MDKNVDFEIRSFKKLNNLKNLTDEEISIKSLLYSLDKERGNLDDYNEKEVVRLIGELVKFGCYPKELTPLMKVMGYSIWDMVKYWGSDWYKYEEPITCHNCKSDLRDLKNGPPFKREIAISDYFMDVTVDYVCPDCYKSIKNGRQYNKEEFKYVPPETE